MTAICAREGCENPLPPRRKRYCSRACTMQAFRDLPITHGLYLRRSRTCPCGTVFEANKPTATYCSDQCRIRIGAYGRTSYGQSSRSVAG